MISKLNLNYKTKLLIKYNYNKDLINILEELVMIKINYYDFNNVIKQGNIICNQKIAEDLIYIFNKLFENKYKIEKIELIDNYNFDDIKSMKNNNTSCFNFRKILNKNKYSNHAYGLAIDINPLYNPYVVKDENKIFVLPQNSLKYVDRTKDFNCKIDENDLCYKLFKERGFKWGGNWDNKDYQHFEKII